LILFSRLEKIIAVAIFSIITLFPVIESFSRLFGQQAISGSSYIVQHLVLWIGIFGGVIAAKENNLLALTQNKIFNLNSKFDLKGWIPRYYSFFILFLLTIASYDLISIEYRFQELIAPNIPRWFAQIILPLGFGAMTMIVLFKSYRSIKIRLGFVIVSICILIFVSAFDLREFQFVIWLGLSFSIIALILGAPIFLGLGGIAILLFWFDYMSISSIPSEAYRIVIKPTLPTIPLFTLAGFVLAESNTSKRLVNVFRSLFGWLPGGTPVVVVILCGFFTSLTGGSGVTILALGGLLLPMLVQEGYKRSFSIGLITVSGSIGLLFVPSLPLIIYSVRAGINVVDTFIGGLLPFFLLVVLISGYAIFQGKIQNIKLKKFQLREALLTCYEAIWELIIPLIILFGVFAGYTTLVETAAFLVIYVVIVEVYLYKDIDLKMLPSIMKNCASITGGVLIIIGIAMGLTSYLVDAQFPQIVLEWSKQTITSKYIFLLLLNVFLLIAGCLMDIFSAIIIIVPLIKPLGIYFDIHPVHLAIIFIANLELGFLTPPVGMNLFLSAYRFKEDMNKIYKATLPFFIVKLIAVVLITYVPFITIGLLQ